MSLPKIKVLFVGESWLGSCARSLKEALTRNPDIDLDEVNEDLFFPMHRTKWLRGINRLLYKAHKNELFRQILHKISVFKPNYVVVYKGYSFDSDFIRKLRILGIRTVNIYPDHSPHAYGRSHREAVGEYDIIISTKPFHRNYWQTVYGYSNACEFVPQGYDPYLHLAATPPDNPPFDITLVATWRPEYGALMKRLADLISEHKIKVAIGGYGWDQHRSQFPSSWFLAGELLGRSYIHFLRKGKICIAPVNREVLINGVLQPGDEDTTRTYELAAAHCFFIHRRTPYVETIYDENEVPMYDTPEDLAGNILRFLLHPNEMIAMAAQAHRRAVPAYSLDRRATEIINFLRT